MTNTTAYSYAPFSISYAARTPIISTAEYQNAPQALDIFNLLPGGSLTAQMDALTETIGRASSWCDQWLFGAWGTISATAETENARIWGSYRNTLIVHPNYWPCVEVRSFAYSALPGGLASNSGASITPAGNITIYPQQFEVAQGAGTSSFSTGQSGFGGFGSAWGIQRRVQYDCLYTYVAGWPNTTLSASVVAGATSVTPTSVVGIYPGSLMTIYDLPNDEPVTVASTYVPGASIVPLAAPLNYAHTTAATLSNMPPAIKQAAVWATSAFIKQRGSGALEVADMGAVTKIASGAPQNSGNDLDQAKMILNTVRQQYVGN